MEPEEENNIDDTEVMTADVLVKESDKAGLPPGTLIYLDEEEEEEEEEGEEEEEEEEGEEEEEEEEEEKTDEEYTIQIIEYNEQEQKIWRVKTAEDIQLSKDYDKIVWIHTTGLRDVEKVRLLGEKYNISPLTLEDIVNQLQRPKVEDFENYIFTVLKEIHFNDERNETNYEQISIITMDKMILTFIDKETNIFNRVIQRIRKDKKIRKFGTDYLTYALIDIVVDHYFFVLEAFEEWFANVEKETVEAPERENAKDINKVRTELSIFNKAVWPLLTVVEKLEKHDSKLIKKSTRVYFRDIYDHVVRITETIDTDREIVSGIFDLYNAGISKRLNETIRILTVISTIFIPLTFIAGVYGMNFDNMPELYWEYGYYICIAVMIIMSITMLAFFKKKKWF